MISLEVVSTGTVPVAVDGKKSDYSEFRCIAATRAEPCAEPRTINQRRKSTLIPREIDFEETDIKIAVSFLFFF